jgi:heme-degrading monooxygenase HmoA
MIERHVTFEVYPDKGAEFEELFVSAYRPAMATMPGFVKVELLRDQSSTQHYQMVIRFDSADAAGAWRDSEAHQALKPRLKALYAGSSLQVYDVIA